jgi:hypothetical protein
MLNLSNNKVLVLCMALFGLVMAGRAVSAFSDGQITVSIVLFVIAAALGVLSYRTYKSGK